MLLTLGGENVRGNCPGRMFGGICPGEMSGSRVSHKVGTSSALGG